MAESMNQSNQQGQYGSRFDKSTVRLNINASGDKQDASAMAVLISKALHERLPDLNIEIFGQDQRIQAGLDAEDLSQVFKYDIGKVLLVVDQNQNFEETTLDQNLQNFHVPMEATQVSHERSLRFLAKHGEGPRSTL